MGLLDPPNNLTQLVSTQAAQAAAEAAAATAASISASKAPITARYLTTPTGGNDTALIQSVLDSAGADEFVRITGTYNISSTIFITKNLDASGAVFNYTGTGLAVQIGSTSSATHRKRITLPRILCAEKTGLGWTAGTIGVKVTNLYASDSIYVPYIVGFETGLLVYGENLQGTSYCTFIIGHLDNNKVSHRISADSATDGWSNQNTYIGGRWSHNSGEGAVAGSTHVLIEHLTGGQSDPNNNTWVNPSLESPNIVEWTINVDGGSSNLFINPRFESVGGGAAKVRWGANSRRNNIIGGGQAETMVETHISGSGLNGIIGTSRNRIYAQAEPGTVMENNTGNNAPIISLMGAGTVAAGNNPTTAYTARITANSFSGKRTTDSFDRVRVDSENGRLYVGSAAAAPVAYWGGSPTAMFLGGGVALTALTDNTQDIGTASALRFRNLHLAGYIKLANGPQIITGTGTPEAVVTAPIGSHFMRSDGGAGTSFYVKESGAGNTGWVAK